MCKVGLADQVSAKKKIQATRVAPSGENTFNMKATKPDEGSVALNDYGEDQPLPQFMFLVLVQSSILLLLAVLADRRNYPGVHLTDLILLGIGTIN